MKYMIDMKNFSLAKHDPQIQELISKTEHKALARWAIDCLNRVLYIFEERYPEEKIPQTAVSILEEWINDKITMWEARKYCRTVLELARKIEKENKACCQIVRAASHCLATCHVPAHAEGTAMYVVSAIKYLNQDKQNVAELMQTERKWQIERLIELKSKYGNIY